MACLIDNDFLDSVDKFKYGNAQKDNKKESIQQDSGDKEVDEIFKDSSDSLQLESKEQRKGSKKAN